MKMRREAKIENALALCKEEMKREETSQRGRKKTTQQACGTKQSNKWHKTKPKMEGYKITKKPRKWTAVAASGMGILGISICFSFNIYIDNTFHCRAILIPKPLEP